MMMPVVRVVVVVVYDLYDLGDTQAMMGSLTRTMMRIARYPQSSVDWTSAVRRDLHSRVTEQPANDR